MRCISRNQPEHWLERAEHARTDAKFASETTTRAKLFGVANAYEVIARRAEWRAKIRPLSTRLERLGNGLAR